MENSIAILFLPGRDGRLIGRLPSGKVALPVDGNVPVEYETHRCTILKETDRFVLARVHEIVYDSGYWAGEDPEEVCRGHVWYDRWAGGWFSFVSFETKERREAEEAARHKEYEEFLRCEEIRNRLVRKEPVSQEDITFLEGHVTEGNISPEEEQRLRELAAQKGGEYETRILTINSGRIIKGHYVRFPDGTWCELELE